MLVSSKLLLADAEDKDYAIPAFNFYNLDILFSILDAAEEKKSPVILQIYSVYYSFLRAAPIAAAALSAIKESSVPAALHLDHSSEYNQIISALENGFNSVMIDASNQPLEKNIETTSKVVRTAHSFGAFTEAELGKILKIGQNDNRPVRLTEPDEAYRFVRQTGVDSLAPAVGSAHGIYIEKPVLDFDRIKRIKDKVRVPLVLHGGSSTPDEIISKAISCGITKLNIGTELKYRWSEAIREVFETEEKEPRVASEYARDRVKEVVKLKIELCDSCSHSKALGPFINT